MTTVKKCCKCKRELPLEAFMYKGRDHSTCESCAIKGRRSDKCESCDTIATFGFEGQKALRCKKHILPNMINVKNKKCQKCHKKRPNFNFEGEIIALYCGDCKESNMIDVKSRKCQKCHKKCPHFNFEGEIIALYCGDCKESNMIDVKHKRCLKCNKKRPHFNLEGEVIALYCGDCKETNMVDVKHKKCQKCGKRAYYGFPHNSPTACSQHRKSGMLNPPNKKCAKHKCTEIAIYGIKRPIHCEQHKDLNDINLVEQKCANPSCENPYCDIVDEKGLCISFCSIKSDANLYKKYSKYHEEKVATYLRSEFGEITREFTPDSSCGRERVDFIYNFPTYSVFTEVDEKCGHNDRCTLGEFNRMKNLCMANGGMETVFIRYNPDPYIDHEGKKQKIPEKKRLETLGNWVRYLSEKEPEYMFSIVYLFYNGYNPTQTKLYEIDPYDLKKRYTCEDCEETFYLKSMYTEHVENH